MLGFFYVPVTAIAAHYVCFMKLQKLKEWYNGSQDYESGKALYLSLPQGQDPSLAQKLKSWQPSSFLTKRLVDAIATIVALVPEPPPSKPVDVQLVKLRENAIALHEAHKKLYYIIQAAKRISNAKRLNLAMDLLDIANKKRKAWDRHDHFKKTGDLLPDPEVASIDIDINDAVAIHKKLVATNLNIFRHKNKPEKAALVQKHVEMKNYLLGELRLFRR